MSAAQPAEVHPFGGIRQPRWLRLYTAVFGSIWCGYFVVLTIVGLVNGIPVALVALVPAAFGTWFFSRFFRTGVEVEDDELVVRNRWRTYRILRQDLEDLRLWAGLR